MPLRPLFVLLVMLNFGVATWWLLRPGPSEPVPWNPPTDVPRLQLVGEADAADAQAADARVESVVEGREEVDLEADPEANADGEADGGAAAVVDAAEDTAGDPVPAASTQATTSPLRCLAYGPYADAAAVAGARAALLPLGASRVRVRDVVEARAWDVLIPPQSDRAAADALAARIREAGFSDLLVVPSGDRANGIALGRYGSEPAARRREASLRAAGFPAQAAPQGDAATRHWLDIAVGPRFDADAARRAAAAPRMQDVDCAGIVDAGAAR